MTEKAPVRTSKRDGLLDTIENIFTGGYGKKEDLREIDKALRDLYFNELRELRHRWEKVYLAVLDAGQSNLGRGFKQAIQSLDRITSSIQRADYGYAGLMDRTVKIREEALSRVLEYDRTLIASIDGLKSGVASVEKAVDGGSWAQLQSALGSVKESLKEMGERWRAREGVLNQS